MSWRRVLRRASWDRERLEEIDSYLAIETDENIARGMSDSEARASARRKLGNSTLIREEIYRMNTIAIVETLGRDVRHVLRMLRHNPTFAVVALLTLAIGIGGNTAVFSVVNSVLLKPLPYPKAEELVAVAHTAPGFSGLSSIYGDLRLSASMFVTYSEHNRAFQALGVWSTATMSVTGLAEPEQIRAVLVSDGILRALDVPPIMGRWLSQADHTPGSPATVMLSYGYWQRRFGADRSVVGRKITVDSRLREIVGVMPQAFRVVNTDSDLFVPLSFERSRLILPGFSYQSIARLKPGVTIAKAEADIARLVPVWMNSWPMLGGIDPRVYERARIAPAIRPLKKEVVGNAADILWVLMGTIGIVMVIAAANVANLMLVRTEARQQELAVRAALGAGWGRLVRELLLESLVLGVIGGALGLGLAHAGLRFLVAAGPGRLPRLNEIALDGWALGFTVAVSLLSGLMCGLIPAFKYAGPSISMALRSAGRALSHSRDRHRARNVLVVAQVALALVLLVSAGLMIRTFQALAKVDAGFTEANQLQVMRISIPGLLVREPERVARMQNEIVDKVAAIPGVSSVAFTSGMPMEGFATNWDAITVEGKTCTEAEIPPMRVFKSISPRLFQTAGTRLIAGRDFNWTDLYGRRPVVMISENLARELWSSPSAAIGRRIATCLPKAPLREVIGVVQDVHDNGVHEPSPAIVYWPSFGESSYIPGEVDVARTVTFAIRSHLAGSDGFLQQLNQAVWSVNASLPVASVRTMQDVYDQSQSRTSFTLVMLGIAGTVALVLGVIGLYGVISYVVSQRRREIGIRLALGAQHGELERMFVRYGLSLAGIGVAIGLAAAAGLTRLMSSLLFGISPLDPLTYVAVPVVLVAAAVLASYLPARRAALVDPVDALKAE
ncbi:MAG: ABC transporter permease [Acidobacteria bacterium]|nr:ABC transporter permease [Acidobacteriota bacterium]